MHLPKHIKKILKWGGLGCALITGLFLLITGFLFLKSVPNTYQWVNRTTQDLWAMLPKDIISAQLPGNLTIPPILQGFLKLPPKDQIALGKEISAQEGLDANTYTATHLKTISVKMIKSLPEKYKGPVELGGWDWQVNATKSKSGEINAIALPGGRIYVYDGLLKLTNNNPDQLAAIIGHEMAHVVEEHSAKQMRNSGLLQKTVESLLQSSNAEGEGEVPQQTILKTAAAQMGKQITEMQLSQSAEYQADELGFQFMQAAGYNPAKGLEVLEKLAKMDSQKNSLLTGVFSTHPPTINRIERLRKHFDTQSRLNLK